MTPILTRQGGFCGIFECQVDSLILQSAFEKFLPRGHHVSQVTWRSKATLIKLDYVRLNSNDSMI